MHPIIHAASIRAAVFFSSISRSTSIPTRLPSDWRSIACPPPIPFAPDFSASTYAARQAFPAPTRLTDGAHSITSNAFTIRASPAKSAIFSPYTLWLEGLPRRKSSSSIHGRSSWISEKVCTISTAQANGSAASTSPPHSLQNAKVSSGRTLLPGREREYSIESSRICSRYSPCGKQVFNRRLIRSRYSVIAILPNPQTNCRHSFSKRRLSR